MADGVSINIEGLQDLNAKLLAMKNDFAAKSIVSAAYTTNKLTMDRIKDKIEQEGLVDTGLLQSSIKRKKIVYSKDGKVVILTGVDKNVKGTDSKGNARVPWRYANVLEARYGFVKKTFDENKQALVQDFVNKLQEKVKKYDKQA